MAEEEKIEATAPESNTEEFIDDDGLKHVVVRDAEGKPLSDQAFDKDGNLRGEGIYKDGQFAGTKEYRTDDQGLNHVVVRDVEGKPISDQAFDKDGNLRGEGIYKDGQFAGTKEYRTDDQGLNHVVVRDVEGKPISDQAFDKDGNLRGEGIYKDGQFVEEQKYDDVNTTLPAVRGQEMPARTQETQQEQPDLHPVRVEQTAETVNTVLPAVRGNEMPERAQESEILSEQEANLAQSFGNYAQKPSKESLEAFAFDLQHVVADYVGSGMTLTAATQKASEFLGQLYDRAEAQNLDPQMLANLRNAKEAADKFMANEANKENTPAMTLNSVNAGRQDENIEDVEFEEIPAEPVVENDGNETADAPVVTDENEGNETADTPAATNANEGNEEAGTPASTNANEGNEESGNTSATTNANENTGNTGSFTFGNTAENENTNTASNTNETDDLVEQMMNTAFKNRYLMLEDVENDPSHLCPFRQFKTSTLVDNSSDKKNPYVRMDLETGARVYNRPGQIDVHYDTKEGEDFHISFEDALALVRLGQEKGWTSANLEGPQEYKEQMFLAMYTLGMEVHGDFIPSKKLLKEAEAKRQQYQADAQHAASIDQRFDAIEKERKAAGIERPEDVGKEFMNRLKEKGLGYTPPVQNNENSGNANDGNDTAGTPAATNTNDGNETAGTPAAPANTNDGNDTAGTPAATNTNDGNETAGTPAAPANTNDGNETAGTPAAPATPAIENNGQEAVQQPQQLQLPEHVESQQPQRLQLPEHVESQQPQQLQLPEHVESQQQQTALVPVTPGIQKKMEAVAQSATTALAKTDPAKAQQAAAQIAATPGIANQLQLAGKTANEAKGNDVKAAQQQHQQETALVLAARSNNHSK